jgi:cytosine/adenosine deaminase-related metal-dependent hydrolase
MTVIIKAKYALLAPGVVRQDVRIEVDGPRIVAVRSGFMTSAPSPDYVFGNAVITPGFTNAHSHLELEACLGRVPFNGNFIEWLQTIRDMKKVEDHVPEACPVASLRELAAAGCTTVLDHHQIGLDWQAVEEIGIRYFGFLELFQFNTHSPDIEQLRKQRRDSYAPHAPYSSSKEIAQSSRTLADEFGYPISVHLSEISEEVRFIRDGESEEIRKLLTASDSFDEGWRGTGLSPVAYYASLGMLNGPAYVIHTNYCEPGDLDLLAELKPTVVYCPYSHAFFGHPQHPLMNYINAGVSVAIGTDSVASNDALSPVREAALVHSRFPELALPELFAMTTSRGLGPLGWDGFLGKLEPGYMGDLAVFELDGDPGADFDTLFGAVLASGKSSLTLAGGRVVHSTVARRVASSAGVNV